MIKNKQLNIFIDKSLHDYPVIIEAGITENIGAVMQKIFQNRSFKSFHIVTDDVVAPIYLEKFLRTLKGDCHHYIIESGEKSKNMSALNDLLNKILKDKINRQSVIIALGGGVIGDLAGFAASILMRGVSYIQIPTTLLAQVDSSVGGKTGINTDMGKNLIGSFYHPSAVFIDPLVLQTLPLRELKAGYAEVLKYSFINQPLFFKYLDENSDLFYELSTEALAEMIFQSVQTKAEIVAQDPFEKTDVRALLNFGHTFGHALETLGKYDGRLLHGEAVALGMRMAIAFSLKLGLCPQDEAEQMMKHMDKMALIKNIPFPVTADMILENMRKDKKNKNDNISLILLKGLGKAFKIDDVEPQALSIFLEEYLG